MRRVTDRGWSRRRWGTAAIGLALLCALLALATPDGSAQQVAEDGCSPACVILIQVDGLEPKDVNEQTTPYLWRLAHPTVQGQNVPGTALNQRSGWIWQAPRAVMSTGTAPATASLLSGAFPEKTGVPSDDFYGPTAEQPTGRIHQRLGAGGFGDTPHPNAGQDAAEPISSLPIDTLVGEVRNRGSEAAVFLADPGLAQITQARSEGRPFWFPPGDATSATNPEQQFTGDPRLCPVPRYPDGATPPGEEPNHDAFNPSHCPANDMTTMNKAVNDLRLPASAKVGFTFIHLAELGTAKRLAVDTDLELPEAGEELGLDDADVVQPAQALAQTDAAIATFVEQYAQAQPSKWERTVLMVVGSHGYQRTPLANRVPDPEAPAGDPIRDLSDYVARQGSLTLVPQGTLATIYYGLNPDADPAGRLDALRDIKDKLMGDVNEQCAERYPGLPPCIENVYYVDGNTPDVEPAEKLSIQNPTWRLDARHPTTGERTGASGDLVVKLGTGWASGRAVGLVYQGLDGLPFTNPNMSSSGGPQERGVAALVNGPSQSNFAGAVRNLDTLASSQVGVTELKYYPVSSRPVDPSDPNNPPPVDDPKCPDTLTDPGGLACANDPADVEDDAEDDGHEAQPVTVDFAATISALMQLPFESHPDQLQGRVLQEAFLSPLTRPCVGDECDPPEPEEPPEPPPLEPPPPQDVVVQTEGFNFHGLVRGLKARVVDSRNRTYSVAPRGSVLSTIRLEADFGKPEAAVTLTFYRRTAARRSRARAGRVVRLKAIARFDPFVVKRGHVTMRLKVPPQFKPTYVGLTVREVARTPAGRRRLSGGVPCTSVKTRKRIPFRCTGPTRSAILPVVDARRLHKKKTTGARSSPRRRR